MRREGKDGPGAAFLPFRTVCHRNRAHRPGATRQVARNPRRALAGLGRALGSRRPRTNRPFRSLAPLHPRTSALSPTHLHPREKCCRKNALVRGKSAGKRPLCVDFGRFSHAQGRKSSNTFQATHLGARAAHFEGSTTRLPDLPRTCQLPDVHREKRAFPSLPFPSLPSLYINRRKAAATICRSTPSSAAARIPSAVTRAMPNP